jgi:hypothetical protein
MRTSDEDHQTNTWQIRYSDLLCRNGTCAYLVESGQYIRCREQPNRGDDMGGADCSHYAAYRI